MMSLPDFRYKQIIFYQSKDKEKLCFRADNLIIEDENKKVTLQHSCHRMFALFIIGNITITNVILRKARQFAFPIFLLNSNFHLDTSINNRAEGNTLLRKKQYSPEPWDFIAAKELVRQKINNQKILLKSLRYRSEDDNMAVNVFDNISLDSANDRHSLMGIEGSSSKLFFKTYFRNLNWTRREPRCKRDINNLLLDIGYSYLFNFVDAILAIYGFDVYCGVYHTFFYQRKSLACDIMEPFRCIIDRRLRKAHNLKQIDTDDFFVDKNVVTLKYKSQGKYVRLFVKDIIDHKEDIFLYVQKYYRWIMKNSQPESFPIFEINNKE